MEIRISRGSCELGWVWLVASSLILKSLSNYSLFYTRLAFF